MRQILPLFIALCVTALAGCAAPRPTPTATPAPAASPRAPAATTIPTRNTDPCAMRLHEAAGALLLYYATHHELPPNVEALEKAPGAAEAGDFTCPLSHKPYIYNPAGLPAPDPSERLILYDPEPSHGGQRWAVAIIPPSGDGPLIAKVIAVPESHFARLPASPGSTH